MLQGVAVCCSVLQCVVVCCSMTQYDASVRSAISLRLVCSWGSACSAFQTLLDMIVVCCSLLQSVTACCSLLQCNEVYCSVLQCVAV